MCGGGSGGGGSTQYNWNDAIAPYWANALSWGSSLTDPTGHGAYQQYTGPSSSYGPGVFTASSNDPTHRIANITPDQQQAMDYGRALAYGTGNPLPSMNAAQQQEQDTLGGKFLGANPYGSQQNGYTGMDSPFFQQTLDTGLNDMGRAYQLGTAADTNKMFTLAGTYGGSAYQNAVANNQNALGKQMRDYTASMQNDQYNRSAQLTDAQLARGNTDFENERQRQLAAIQPAQNEQQLALQRQQDLMGIGDVNRSYTQDLLNQGYGDWQSQQNRQFQMLDYLSGILGRAQGGISPNMTMTQSGYAASPFSQVVGAGLLGYGLTH